MKRKVGILAVIVRLFLGASAIQTAATHAAVCPSVGQDSDCGVIITITDTGASISYTGQGPYDGVEDTLVGVVNKSKLPIRALGLKSGTTIFGFDGDGLSSYGVGGNARDNTGYGGPNAYFTNIDSSQKAGTVNFVTPIPANGGTAFFSLEESLSSATACQDLINKAVTHSSGGSSINGMRPEITATFTPNRGYSIQQAAQICGFKNFNWQQKLLSVPKPSPFFAAGSSTPLVAPPPFNDPPPGGYSYQNPPNTAYPFYYNLFWPASNPLSLPANETNTTLSFYDAPSDPCLPGAQSAAVSAVAYSICGGKRALLGSRLAFSTHLVGVLQDNSLLDLEIGFSWTDTFNGTSGGLAVTNSSLPVDPNSGSGGITITSVTDTTTYGGFAVTSVNGIQPGGSPQILSSGGACNGLYGGPFIGDIVISAGQNCSFMNGSIAGNVYSYGGSVTLAGTSVSGNVIVDQGGSFSIGSYSEINGSLIVHNLPGGSAQNSICSATIYGNLQFQHNASPVQIGSASPATCDGNVVGGNIEIQNNTGPIAISSNYVSGNLQCVQNSSITGSMNTASHKLGQCSNY